MTSTVIGADRVSKKLQALPRASRKVLEQALVSASLKYETELKKAIQKGSRSGHVYTWKAISTDKNKKEKPDFFVMIGNKKIPVKKRAIPHQASAAGEAPKADGGRLVNSIQNRLTDNGLSAEVFSRLKYAQHLEYGTSKMAPRPVWLPTFHAMKSKITKQVSTAISRVLEANK